MSYWTEDELARFNYFELDGVRSPGVLYQMELGDGTVLNWDKQNGFGLSGDFLRFKGLGLAEFTFRLRLVDKEHRAQVDSADWKRASKPPVQGQPDRRRAIRHPVLEHAEIPVTQVVMLNSPFSVPATEEGGGAVRSYRFEAYRRPLKQTGKAQPPSNKASGEVPNPRQEMIDKIGKAIDAELAKKP